MPTPPRESIGGTKQKQIIDFNFHVAQFDYVESLENYKLTTEYSNSTQEEKDFHDLILEKQTTSYEVLREVLENY